MIIHHSRDSKAHYLIAQYMEDVFRREVRNIGVFVHKGDSFAARFVGETEPGVIDGRRTKSFVAPDVYRQWVQYWRRILSTQADPFSGLMQYPSANYPVVQGGEIMDTGDDSAEQVCQFLYSALVADGGFARAFEPESEEVVAIAGNVAPRLVKEIETTFRSLNILSVEGAELPLVHHPILRRQEIEGTTSEPHRPQFAQQNGRLFVMETVDFAERAKDRARDHAGFASFMFGDLRDAMGDAVVPIAIVRVDPVEYDDETVRYGLSMLQKTASEVIDWTNAAQRAEFVEARRRTALAAA